MQISRSRKTGSRVLVAAAIAVLALSASACGGGKKSSSTTTGAAATEAWAGGVCSAFTAWKSSLEDVKTSLKGGGLKGLSGTELQRAESQVEDATNTLVKSLKKLGPPNTTSGAAAKSDVSNLEDSLSASMSTIKTALPRNPSLSDVVSALPAITTELTKMANSLSATVVASIHADPGGEIEQAFKQAPSCSAYVSS
jgi:hypothetical protein